MAEVASPAGPREPLLQAVHQSASESGISGWRHVEVPQHRGTAAVEVDGESAEDAPQQSPRSAMPSQSRRGGSNGGSRIVPTIAFSKGRHSQLVPRYNHRQLDQSNQLNDMFKDAFEDVNKRYYETLESLKEMRFHVYLLTGFAVVLLLLIFGCTYAIWDHSVMLHEEERTLGSHGDTLRGEPDRFVSKDTFNSAKNDLMQEIADVKVRLTHLQDDFTSGQFASSGDVLQHVAGLRQELALLRGSLDRQKTHLQQQEQSSQEHFAVLQDSLSKASDTAKKALDKTTAVSASTDAMHDHVNSLQQAVDGVSSTAEKALSSANAVRGLTDGCACVKEKDHDCPVMTTECTLWHWYKPDAYDPYCGGNAAPGVSATDNSADGSCQQDSTGNYRTSMTGCCRSK